MVRKITGVEYDVALQGDGFFTVINKNTLGTAETFYTRAGNFRMGEVELYKTQMDMRFKVGL